MLLPILWLAHENDLDPEMRTWEKPPSQDVRKKLCIGLGVSAKALYKYFGPHRIREARRTAGVVQRTERKIGRNEMCHCGSGKKYKHCCGRSTFNH